MLDVDEELPSLAAALRRLHRAPAVGPPPGAANRFRHDRHNRLPHDVVIVDETSMMSLPLMARLLEAVRADARLVLLGDQEQLASVEAGAVLGDIVGPAALPGASAHQGCGRRGIGGHGVGGHGGGGTVEASTVEAGAWRPARWRRARWRPAGWRPARWRPAPWRPAG